MEKKSKEIPLVVTSEQGLAQTIEWYITHQDWIDNVLSGEYMNYYQKKMEQI